jgi:predicted dehydrogenase
VVGEKGAVLLDSFAQHLTAYAKTGPRNLEWVGFGPDPNQPMMQEFVDSIREQRQPSVSWNDGYQALRVVLAAYESAQKHQPVSLDH